MSQAGVQVSMKQKIYPWLIVVAWAFMGTAAMQIVMVGMGQYFKPISDAFGESISTLAFMLSFGPLALSFAAPIIGRLYLKLDSRLLLTITGIMIFGTYASMAFFTEIWMWAPAGVILGAGMAGVGTIGAPIFITNWFAKRAGFALGLYSILIALMVVFINPMVAMVIKSVGYQSSLLIWAGICCVMYFPWVFFVLRFKPEQIGLKPYGYVEGESAQEEGSDNKKSIDATRGVSFKNAVRSGTFIFMAIAIVIMFNHSGWMNNMSQIVQIGWGYDIIFGGLVMSFYTGAQFTAPIVGWLVDRIGAVKTVAITLAIICVGFIALWLLHNITFAVLFGAFCIGYSSVNMKMVIPLVVRDIFGQKDHAKIYSFVFGIGQFLGTWSVTLVALIGELAGSYDVTMIIGFVVTAIALCSVLLASAMSKKLDWEE
jgi:MFS family permease